MFIFLRAKNWQLFLVLVCIIPGAAIGLFKLGSHPNPFRWAQALLPLDGLLYYGWLLAISTHLNAQLPGELRRNMRLFCVVLALPVVYSLMSCLILLLPGPTHFLRMHVQPWRPWIRILSWCCLLYCTFIASRVLRTAELKERPLLIDYVLDTLLFVFFPLGVWFIQPRVQRSLMDLSHQQDPPTRMSP